MHQLITFQVLSILQKMSISKNNSRVILTARLLLECDEQLLFLEQTPLNGGGFTLPGGKIESEEFAKEALIRETFEEIGIRITKKDLKFAHVTHRKTENVSEIILFFHSVADASQRACVKEFHKFQSTVWLPISEAPNGLTSVLKYALKLIKEGKFFSQFSKIKQQTPSEIVQIVEFSALTMERDNIKKGLEKLKKKTRDRMIRIPIRENIGKQESVF